MIPSVEGPVASAIGSLPHTDPDAAARLVLDLLPALPAAPQLPNRSPREGMVAQIDEPLDGDGWSGLTAFVAAAAGHDGPIKVQLCGPLTYAVYAPCDLDAAVGKVRGQAAAVLDRVSQWSDVVVFLDEPALATEVPFGADAIADALRATLRAGWGIHCCGETDVGLLAGTGAGILSLPAEVAAVAVPAAFVEAGGWVAWGIDDERQLQAAWETAAERGLDPDRIRAQAFVTPVCGLAGATEAKAEATLRMVAQAADKVAFP